ncbi:MAG: PAS domain-containing protein [Candidatus Lambdaproteobacteria bacterium]|nr:PAS domain-containing protein [Candidatus Lambdaproteobacteria bacterium]
MPANSDGQPGVRSADRRQIKIRNRIVSIVVLLLVILLLVSFLFNYPGFHNWETIDTNLSMFVAVNVNIVLLTTVFYMILRNLFKLVYERKRPLAGVGLKTKLIIAFVALSLPSTAFHLMASGFMGFLFENLFQGEHQQALESSRVILDHMDVREDRLLRLTAEKVLGHLPKEPKGYLRADWLRGYNPSFSGGIFVYEAGGTLIAEWISDAEVKEAWQPPPRHFLAARDGFYWKEVSNSRQVRRLLLPVTGSKAQLRFEVLDMPPPELTRAVQILAQKQLNKPFITRDLYWLVISVLVAMTLLIIFAATWIAIYLARGFVTPVEQLAAATQRVSHGELGVQVDSATLGPMEGDFRGLVQAFNLMSRQLRDQQQQVVATAEDLRRSHVKLGERNRLVELLLENVDAGILSLDPQGIVTSMNRAAKRLLQTRVEPGQQRHYRMLLGRDVTLLLDDMMERLRLDGRQPATQNLTLIQNRKPVHVEMAMLGLENAEGASEGVVVVLKDVTAIQRTQRAQAWREVARRIAHEIKNPLTPIQLSAQRIRRRYLSAAGGDDGLDVLDQCTQTIINEVSSLKKMVNEFSQFAKLPESQPVPDNLNKVILELAPLYENGLPEQIRLELDLGEDIPDFPLDREQIKRAFTNLVDNAAAAIEDGGTILVHTAYDPDTRLVTAEVSDDGTGVPDHIRTRLFEPYTSTKEGGTGLGLSIVNQIVSDHNGFMRYSERKPSGSRFSMEFPLK